MKSTGIHIEDTATGKDDAWHPWPHRIIIIAILLTMLVVASAACSRHVPLEKKPYIILDSEGRRVVKVETLAVQPHLEYFADDSKLGSAAMKRSGGSVYEAILPSEANRYRIISSRTSSPMMAARKLPRPDEPFKIIIYGDNRTGKGDRNIHRQLVRLMNDEHASLVINTGDLVSRASRDDLWAEFFEDIAPLTANTPYVAVYGNHDGSRGQQFERYFRTSSEKRYTTFRLGDIQFLLLNSVKKIAPGHEQYDFLINALTQTKRATPTLVFMHRSPFSGGKHGDNDNLIREVVPLFEHYGVPFVANGHDHDYQRIGPRNGVLYLVSGGGGAPLYPIKSKPEIGAAFAEHHYVICEIKENSMQCLMKNAEGIVRDQFTIALPFPPENKCHGNLRTPSC